jgi:hypothetical protein
MLFIIIRLFNEVILLFAKYKQHKSLLVNKVIELYVIKSEVIAILHQHIILANKRSLLTLHFVSL